MTRSLAVGPQERSATGEPPGGGTDKPGKATRKHVAMQFTKYSSGVIVYFTISQFVAMGVLSRRLDEVEFGAFALVYSLVVVVNGLTSRTLSQTSLRLFPGLGCSLGGFLRSYSLMWLAGALVAGLFAVAVVGGVGEHFGVPPSFQDPRHLAIVATYATGAVAFDAGMVLLRMLQRFSLVAVGNVILGLVLGIGVVVKSPGLALAPFALASWAGAAFGLSALAAMGSARAKFGREAGDSAYLTPSLGPRLVGFFFLSALGAVALRYLDRFLVGAWLGPADAGVYFAVSNSVMATLMPLAFSEGFFDGYIAQFRSLQEVGGALIRLLRRTFLLFFFVGPVVVLAASWVVLQVVYPNVDALAVLPALGFLALGKTLYVSRTFTMPLILRFGAVARLVALDYLVLLCEVTVVLLLARRFGLMGAAAGAGIALALGGTGSWALTLSLTRGSKWVGQ